MGEVEGVGLCGWVFVGVGVGAVEGACVWVRVWVWMRVRVWMQMRVLVLVWVLV